ncbi:MAG: hypothetical protein LKE40_10970 [Spirochaetia bacterium]|nr:hypothetical protein [Spirochaetia bacterium]MCH3916215.1 hypothetical protein [Spirochaetia bacterium]MCH3917363.1 hypothetical protein [Spirochaetia bacterium]MCH3917375.1 hypothetical protein [Spirochaetia bacterium]MCH3917950.1 hypothetical protein [Spirochaetia bacterium]
MTVHLSFAVRGGAVLPAPWHAGAAFPSVSPLSFPSGHRPGILLRKLHIYAH